MKLAARRTLGTVLGGALAAAGLQVMTLPAAHAAGATHLVINEVYGGGGNSGAPYTYDFVELFNPTDAAVSLSGMSLQYRSAASTTAPASTSVNALSGSVAPHGHFLVQLAAGTTVLNKPLPNVDLAITTSPLALSGTGGQVYLVNSTSSVAAQTNTSAPWTFASSVVDFVGWGTSTTVYEGTGAAGATANATSISRKTLGADTDNNAADFAAATTPTPEGSATDGGSSTPTPLALAAVTDKAAFRNTPIAPIALTASGGKAPYAYSLSGDVDGSGLKVSSAGVISGLPTAAGTYHLTAKVTDSADTPATAKQDFTLTVTDGDTANHVVIAEVWGDGGYGGTAYKNSFIELYNPTDSTIGLSGDSIAYVPASNATPPVVGATLQSNLTGDIPAHSFYLIAGVSSNGGSNGVDLPAPDDNSTINWHYADGTIALLDTQDETSLTAGDLTDAPHVVDAVGYGPSTGYVPVAYEGAVTGTATGSAIAALRSPVGTDTDNNHTDFTTIAPYAINANGDTQPELKLTPVTDQTALTNQPMTPIDLDVSGGVGAITYSLSGQPAGVSIDSATGVISGTPSAAGTFTLTAKAADTLNDVASISFKLTVGSFLVTNPGDQTLDKGGPADIQLTASPANTNGYGFALKSGGTLPAGLTLDGTTGEITGTPTATQSATPVTITVTNKDDATTIDVTFSITVTADVTSIATIQGAGQRSSYAPASGTGAGQTVSTEGVVTAVWDEGYSGTGTAAALGTANSGLSGFVIQTPDPDVATSPSSEAIFVFYSGTTFTGKDANGSAITVGDSIKVSGTVSEYKAASAASTETATEITATVANTHKLGASLGTVTVQTTLPATYADREAHEWEAYAPTDTVVTDTYDYESDGELGLASGGKPLVQPTEVCTTAQTSCIQDAETDIVNRGYFLGDGTNTFFLSGSTHYSPNKSGNSAIPLPYMDASTSARVGARVTAPTGHALILGFWPDLSQTAASRPGKWYLQPERAVLGTPGTTTTAGTPDLGKDVVSFEDTRAENATPDPANINADATSNIRVATFNVENFFTETGEAFADDNPAIGNSAAGVTSSTTKGCQYDYDRAGNRELTYQCVSPYGQATAWDPVSGTPTAYKAGVTNAPRGAARQQDLDRQTAKIVTAINGLGGIDPNAVNHSSGADIISLEEIENPNKLKQGITNSPLSPDLSNLKDQGQGTPIANRDAALKYLVDKLNAAAGSTVWGYVKSPEEATDATSMVHMCSILRGDGVTPIDGNAASRANASCSYASTQDVIRSAFIYKVATVVPVGSSDIDFPANPLSPDGTGNNAQPTYNGATPFDPAREPLAQFFKPKGYPNADGFAVIVNHFKSKGGTSTSDDPGITVTGDNKSDPLVGAYNTARTKEAQELVRFANQFAAQWHTDKVLMVGDFNSYTDEDPVSAVLDASKTDPDNGVGALNFSLIESSDASDLTYNYTSNVNVGLDSSGALHVATPNTSGTSGTDQVGYGTVGSIDHEFMSAGFRSMFTGADVWEINANETDAYDYGRFNTNATDFYYGTAPGSSVPADASYDDDLKVATPFRSSDHNPMVMGIRIPALADASAAKVTDVQLVGVNDFHGRLIADSSDGGAAALGGAVDELREQYGADKTLFVSGGDNVGASTFESFTAHDKPSLDALATLGLDVSTVGNHEFDGQASLGAGNVGWKDLVNRLMKPYDATTNPYGPVATAADPSGLPYLAANVTYATDPDGSGPLKAGDTIAPATKSFTIANPLDASKPIKIGFVGTVTPDLVSLESPANLAGIHVDDEAATIAAINGYAAQLKAAGDQIVVLLTHEGAASTDCSSITSAGGSFAQELNGVSDDVDAVLSGHTHLEYSCTMPKKATASNPLTTRPVMQAGSYGVALDQLVYSFDQNGTPTDVTSNIVGVKGPVSTLFSAPDDAAVKSIVDDAVTASATAGAKVLGKLGGPFDRARLSDGTENRGGESTLGNQIAEIQRWATSSDDPDGYVSSANGSAQIAFMNPGGLRADLEGTSSDGSGDLTYRAAADVQPFANELTNMSLTGDQIKTVLEEQWSRDNIDNAKANIPARPFLKLGISKGFTYSYHEVADPVHSGAKLGVIDGMWLDGVPIEADQHYSVTVNSFLATGGDNFWELANGTHQEDTEQTDLQAQVDYMSSLGDKALPVDDSQRGVEITFPGGTAPTITGDAQEITFDVASLDMTGKSAANTAGDPQDAHVLVKLNGTVLGTFAVTHTNTTQPYDDRGTASVDVTLPAGAKGRLTVEGDTTGTVAVVPLDLPKQTSTVSADAQKVTAGSGSIKATVAAGSGSVTPGGSVTFKDGDKVLGTAPVGDDGLATLSLVGVSLTAGDHTITASYGGDATFDADSTTFTLTVVAPLALDAITSQSWTADTAITSVTASATGGTAPYAFSATGLPAGVSITAGGAISGTPTGAGSGTATITVTDATSATAQTTFGWTVAAAPVPLAINPLGAQSWSAGRAITSVTASATGGTTPYTFSATGLPAGVSISSAGLISGTPRAAGSGAATITVTDATSATEHTTLAWTVRASSTGHPTGPTTHPVAVTVKVLDKTIKAKHGKAKVTITVTSADGARHTGEVTLKGGGLKGSGVLKNNKVTITLKKAKPGKHKVRISYSGDATSLARTVTVTIKVRR
ncbi:putative Ig domain-containing protein [Nocardioides sp. BP30]|uniref:putative Ig domain-containing protein n=1 Tax=Nocardioides sp. BP30 TaxID=3036374 RepID=UPI0024682BFF|nr:putative Ig domain-containing protein [Nocardioides sp. BP30]WGL50941.1 putative Ig domain-containing protein [Nocardioides sp. BP30]